MRKYCILLKSASLIVPILTSILACSTLVPVSTPTQSDLATQTVAPTESASDIFPGTWVSIDSDGSSQQLVITANADNSFTMDFIDQGASACGKDANNNPLFSATANGVLTGTGNTISGTAGVFCQRNPAGYLADVNFVFYYEPGSGTITDNQGIVWTKK